MIGVQRTVEDLLAELKLGLEALYGQRLHGLFLYGSYARAAAAEESDVDVLIVLDRIDHYAGEIDRTGYLIADLSLAFAVTISRVFVSHRDWAARETSFLANARAEAIPV